MSYDDDRVVVAFEVALRSYHFVAVLDSAAVHWRSHPFDRQSRSIGWSPTRSSPSDAMRPYSIAYTLSDFSMLDCSSVDRLDCNPHSVFVAVPFDWSPHSVVYSASVADRRLADTLWIEVAVHIYLERSLDWLNAAAVAAAVRTCMHHMRQAFADPLSVRRVQCCLRSVCCSIDCDADCDTVVEFDSVAVRANASYYSHPYAPFDLVDLIDFADAIDDRLAVDPAFDCSTDSYRRCIPPRSCTD